MLLSLLSILMINIATGKKIVDALCVVEKYGAKGSLYSPFCGCEKTERSGGARSSGGGGLQKRRSFPSPFLRPPQGNTYVSSYRANVGFIPCPLRTATEDAVKRRADVNRIPWPKARCGGKQSLFPWTQFPDAERALTAVRDYTQKNKIVISKQHKVKANSNSAAYSSVLENIDLLSVALPLLWGKKAYP